MPVVFSTSLSMLTACTDGASEGIGKSRDPRAVLTGAGGALIVREVP